MPEIVHGSLYDFPKYYDLLFGSDWKAEFDFLHDCFQHHAGRPVRRIFEPACGTGRLLIKLAQAGYEIAGNDLNPKAVAYCNQRLARHGFPSSVEVGDMSDFQVARKYDAAFNTINSFRHLDSEEAAASHLQCMGNALEPGGLYILGIHLLPDGSPMTDEESWSARRGNLVVNSYMWSKEIDRRKRNERLGMVLDIYTPTRHLRIVDEMNYRTYTRQQFRRLLDRVGLFRVEACYDFGYDIDLPVTIGPRTEDVVFVLKRLPAS